MQASPRLSVTTTGNTNLLLMACALLVSTMAAVAVAQENQAPTQQHESIRQYGNRYTPAMQYFGERLTAYQTQQSVRRQLPPPKPLQLSGSKPFQGLSRPANLSPYLGLNAVEGSVPNYYAYVRPQQQQQLANKAQQREINQLQLQLRNATAKGIVSSGPNGGVPTTGRSAQFLNVGEYFPTVQ